ncbi:MAG: FAD-dependent oxidoreductase [Nitrososphaerota archaeon]|jgi:NAD(P)H-nitrite reductase large subunit|nr:FAD-dependent oxidoreductase [Nitrososphaerota archaeon]
MKYVIIGNSAAGVGAVEGIRQIDIFGEIVIITNESHHTYSRPLISYFLFGKTTEEQMRYRGDSFYAENHCTLIQGTVTEVNAKTKQVYLSNGNQISFDKLLVATGSTAFVPPFEGLDLVDHKYTFMSFDDAQKLNNVLSQNKQVLIVGAGLIGLKCAEGILKRVAHVTVLDLAPKILSSILDDDSAKLVQFHLENMGLSFRLSCSVKRFEYNTAILDNGDRIPFDVLVLAVGVRPNTGLLKEVAQIDRGIFINEKSETTTPDIYAAGDCTQTFDVSSGQNKIMALLPNAYIQGECAGINMAGGKKSFDKAIPMNAIGFFGLHIITAGSYNGDAYTENKNGNYKRLFYSENKLNGYILVGNVEKAGIYTSLIRERTPLDTIDFVLVCEKPGLMAFTKNVRMVKLGGEKIK